MKVPGSEPETSWLMFEKAGNSTIKVMMVFSMINCHNIFLFYCCGLFYIYGSVFYLDEAPFYSPLFHTDIILKNSVTMQEFILH